MLYPFNADDLAKIKQAREVISKPENWLKGRTAVDHSGWSVLAADHHACKWCSAGALDKIGENNFQVSARLETIMSQFLPSEYNAILSEDYIDISPIPGSLIRFNDDWNTTHEKLLAKWDEIIQKMEEHLATEDVTKGR